MLVMMTDGMQCFEISGGSGPSEPESRSLVNIEKK
jgi:hypothetical protein